MRKLTKYLASFYAAGSFCADVWTVEVPSADPTAVQWPDRAYAFRLHERVDMVDGNEVYEGKQKSVGPMYYHPSSFTKTLADVEATADPRDEILLWNMRTNGWDSVVYPRGFNWPQPFVAGEHCILGRVCE